MEPEVIVEMARFVVVACWSEVFPPTVTAPAKVEVTDVDVAKSAPTVGVDVPTMLVPLKESRDEFEKVVAPVPPLPSPNVPETCVARLICPDSVESPRQLFTIAKQPLAMVMPLAWVEVAAPPTLRLETERLPVKVDVPAPVTERDGVVRSPLLATEVVPMEPNAAVLAREELANDVVVVAFVAVAFVVVSPTLKAIWVVVALFGKR